jgi:hypothetical protein
MAESPAHKFGQIIGDVLEAAIGPLLKDFATKHNLYLDKKGPRPARSGSKVSWTDLYGNTHDLDFVLERNGTDSKIGIPVAFIETAWRRYTKHSRNKAQEIQGAIMPLAETHKNTAPFKGAVLAGVFTEGAITQLKSLGFTVLYFPYENIVKAFGTVGIDASFDEDTLDSEFKKKVKSWTSLPDDKKRRVIKQLLKLQAKEVDKFIETLAETIVRRISSVRIIPLHGKPYDLRSISEAISFIETYDENNGSLSIIRYEVEIKYNNGDNIRGEFRDKKDAVEFLQNYL